MSSPGRKREEKKFGQYCIFPTGKRNVSDVIYKEQPGDYCNLPADFIVDIALGHDSEGNRVIIHWPYCWSHTETIHEQFPLASWDYNPNYPQQEKGDDLD